MHLTSFRGLDHLYTTLFRFELDTADEVFRAASCRSLYMLLRVLIAVTSHHLVDALPLFAKTKPLQSLPQQVVWTKYAHVVGGVRAVPRT